MAQLAMTRGQTRVYARSSTARCLQAGGKEIQILDLTCKSSSWSGPNNAWTLIAGGVWAGWAGQSFLPVNLPFPVPDRKPESAPRRSGWSSVFQHTELAHFNLLKKFFNREGI